MTLAYVDCFSGVSGDMLLGALLHAGVRLDDLRTALARLPLAGYALEAEAVSDHGISGIRAHVRLDAHEHAHRRLADIAAIIDAGDLPGRARERALRIFQRLAEAEGVVHGVDPAEITFHEVGAVDSIVDTVGVAVGLELLGVDDLYCSELPLTSGRVRSAHGPLPIPAPATLEALKGTAAVWRDLPAQGELVTPTGAAVVATLARFERPTMRVSAIGYGFGSRALPWANCVRVLVGETTGNTGLRRDTIVVVECNIDNMTGEALGWLMERLLAEGALDVSYAPLQMKKQRPGALLTVIATPADAERLSSLIVRESGTLGVRLRVSERLIAERRIERIETSLGPARVKLKLLGDQIVSVTPEYEDVRALAALSGEPFEQVAEQVRYAARTQLGLDN